MGHGSIMMKVGILKVANSVCKDALTITNLRDEFDSTK